MKETPVPPPLPNSNQNLNDLPQEVLVYILSFLPTIEAIQTSLISRKWRNLWFFLTSFNFSFETCFPYFDNPLPFYTRRMTRPFANFVDRALTTRPADPAVHSFRLSFIYDSDYEVRVESWIRTAVTHLQARELHLDFYIDYDYDFSVYKYEFFFSELRNGCVQVLKLTSCNITLPDDMDLGLLRSMFLDQVNLEDEEVRKLFSGCPNLEHFELRNCLGVKGLFIRSTKLKKLALGFVPNLAAFSWNTTEIEIDCPNLLSLSFTECDFNQFVLKKAAALVELSIHLSVLESEDYHLWRRTVRLLLQAPNVKKLKMAGCVRVGDMAVVSVTPGFLSLKARLGGIGLGVPDPWMIRSSVVAALEGCMGFDFDDRGGVTVHFPLLELESILLYSRVDGNGNLSASYTRCGGLNGTYGGFGCDNNGFLTAAAARGIYQVAVGWQILHAPKVHGLGSFGLGLLVDWVVSLATNHGGGYVLLCYGGYCGAISSNWARWAWYGLEGLLQGWIWMGWACFWSGWASWALN
ncbi:putative F-box domain, leucine-rich repeat domain, L domain-containing protein [Rosa chinensis]|uniref:Putative F-box domain, leucine-rich repeat domain, L domain-containing protein n=1 Tax=Rosa chinensis TaxID=74649 RepID=A0A2P6P730_ROSCH|nr:putative F-box domain, leucine-rich repeat domain, L domain-containing protein [Rosa chinensis]